MFAVSFFTIHLLIRKERERERERERRKKKDKEKVRETDRQTDRQKPSSHPGRYTPEEAAHWITNTALGQTLTHSTSAREAWDLVRVVLALPFTLSPLPLVHAAPPATASRRPLHPLLEDTTLPEFWCHSCFLWSSLVRSSSRVCV